MLAVEYLVKLIYYFFLSSSDNFPSPSHVRFTPPRRIYNPNARMSDDCRSSHFMNRTTRAGLNLLPARDNTGQNIRHPVLRERLTYLILQINEIKWLRWVWRNGRMKYVARENRRNPEEKLSRHLLVHHETHMVWPRRELRTSAMGDEHLTAWATETAFCDVKGH